MDKAYYMLIGALLVILILVVGAKEMRDIYLNQVDEIEEKEQKIEMLQEENANLHDDVWNLNNQLMKEDK